MFYTDTSYKDINIISLVLLSGLNMKSLCIVLLKGNI